jgi:hypothetical protein
LLSQSPFSQPSVSQIAVLKACGVAPPWVCSSPVRIRRATSPDALSSVVDSRKISASSITPNSSRKNGTAIRANSTAAAPPLARAKRPARPRKLVVKSETDHPMALSLTMLG